MLTKWLTDRPSRNAKKDHSFRPWLESLEERNAPSGHGGGDGNGHGNGHNNGNGGNTTTIIGASGPTVVQSGNVHNNVHVTGSLNGNTNDFNSAPSFGVFPSGVFFTPPPATGGISQSSSINAHGSFNHSTFTNSFNNTMNVTVNLPPAQVGAVGGLLGISGFLSSALSNPQLGTLLDNEIALAVDNYLTGTPAIATVLGSTVVSDLKTDAAALIAAIEANPVESNPIGAAVGMFVYDLTSGALTAAQPTI